MPEISTRFACDKQWAKTEWIVGLGSPKRLPLPSDRQPSVLLWSCGCGPVLIGPAILSVCAVVYASSDGLGHQQPRILCF
jgi:hypothetical protein